MQALALRSRLPHFIFLFLLVQAGPAHSDETYRCGICGMTYKPGAKTSFESVHEGKAAHFCSFSCARRFHKKYPEAGLTVWDYVTGAKLDASAAYFLIRSKNLLKELDFDMPPSVIAFSSDTEAKKAQARLKDGELVKGLAGLEKAYE